MGEGKLAVVACGIFQRELERVIGGRDIDLRLLDQNLHRTPQLMAEQICANIQQARQDGAQRLALGYGMCSNGLVGVRAQCPLVIPRCHDCIALLVGSPARYDRLFREHPGTYYLSAGWLEVAKDPLSIMELEYVPAVGREDAMWAMSTELAHYTHICLLDNGLGDGERLQKRVRENCQVFGKRYLEMNCTLDYFRALIQGPHREADFISLSPNQAVTESMFRKPSAD